MAGASVDLRPNKSFIDPNFEGYKLSLEPLATYKVKLESALDEARLTEEQYSYQHIKGFGLHNHLYGDPWNNDVVFFVDDRWKVIKLIPGMETKLETSSVLQIPDAVSQRSVLGRHNVSLSFPASDWLVLADGTNKLYIIKTGNRSEDQDWKVCYGEALLGEGTAFVILHSVLQSDNERLSLQCLLLHVDQRDEEGDSQTSGFQTVLHWLTFVSEDKIKWTVERTRRLLGAVSPDYAVVEGDGDAVMLASEKPFKFDFDSLHPVETAEENGTDKPDLTESPAYTWTQSAEDVDVQFTLPGNATKSDVLYKLSADHVELALKNGPTLLKGSLHARVEPEASTWLFQENNRLELHVSKAEPASWPTVVIGDSRGELVLDPDQVTQIHERLAQLTSETWNPPPDGKDMPYNAQQLEDCDTGPGGTSGLARFDGNTHSVTHQINLGGNQWLFNVVNAPDSLPCLCLRHDVDGLLWQPVNNPQPGHAPLQHATTFNALGYVQASKRDKKFGTCAPDFSYAALSDCVKHIYIYRKSTPTSTPVRNRKSGQRVGAIAQQQVVSLASGETIMGIVASNDRLFIIAGKMLYMVVVNSPQLGS